MGNGPNPGLVTNVDLLLGSIIYNGPVMKLLLDADSALAGFELATFSFEGKHYNHSATFGPYASYFKRRCVNLFIMQACTNMGVIIGTAHLDYREDKRYSCHKIYVGIS
jgi:hypothetical protein